MQFHSSPPASPHRPASTWLSCPTWSLPPVIHSLQTPPLVRPALHSCPSCFPRPLHLSFSPVLSQVSVIVIWYVVLACHPVQHLISWTAHFQVTWSPGCFYCRFYSRLSLLRKGRRRREGQLVASFRCSPPLSNSSLSRLWVDTNAGLHKQRCQLKMLI